jgi:O-antigen/teichoic acid export membrane protein
MRFLPILLVQVGGLLPGVIVTILVAQMTSSYAAVLWGSLVASAVSLALSHSLATESYRASLDLAVLRSVLVYGLPLLLNGIVILIGSQGDRLLVAILQDAEDLGIYFAISSVTVGASLLLSKLIGNLYLPLRTASRDDPIIQARQHELCGALSLAILFSTMLPMAAFGDLLVRLLFGVAFEPAPLLSTCLAIQAAFRVLRSWPVVGSLSSGRTKDILYSNLLRTGGVAAAFAALLAGHGLLGVALSVMVGEIIGTFYALWRMDTYSTDARRLGVAFGVLLSAAFAIIVVIESTRNISENPESRLLAASISMSTAFLVLMVVSPELRGAMMRGTRCILKWIRKAGGG